MASGKSAAWTWPPARTARGGWRSCAGWPPAGCPGAAARRPSRGPDAEQFTDHGDSLGWELAVRRYSSGLVMMVAGQLGRVAGPVASGLVHPVDGGGGGDAEQVGQDGGGQLGAEVGECGAAAGHGVDAHGA